MARKVFQDFANVLCQRFVEVPSNPDLVSLFRLGGGRLVLDLVARKATRNGHPITPLPYAEDARGWIDAQMSRRNIPVEQLVGASLTVDYEITEFERGGPLPSATFRFSCTGVITSPDRTYTSELAATKRWGLWEG